MPSKKDQVPQRAPTVRGIDDEHDEIIRYGAAFQEFVRAAREIEKKYLASDRTPTEIRAAAAFTRRALDEAMAQVGGCQLGAGPIPFRLIFSGLSDVEKGIYSRVLSPAQHKFGDQYETHDRQMVIGHALAVWDLVVELGSNPTVAKRRIVEVLNRAGFRIPITKRASTGGKTTGEVTIAALDQWRKRARSERSHYADIYRRARENIKDVLRKLGASGHPGADEELLRYLEKFVDATRIEDKDRV